MHLHATKPHPLQSKMASSFADIYRFYYSADNNSVTHQQCQQMENITTYFFQKLDEERALIVHT